LPTWKKTGGSMARKSSQEKYPQAYFQGIVSLARIIKWDVDPTGAFGRTLSPEEIMDKLEERVGPEGRKLFEQFIRKVNKLQAQQQLEAQAQKGVTGRAAPLGMLAGMPGQPMRRRELSL
jgi:2-polyprenyl-3-methyl-5-hydroxy-6-metoxy-1,4-benzoquinol methylase